jgi:hypothetical protein
VSSEAWQFNWSSNAAITMPARFNNKRSLNF